MIQTLLEQPQKLTQFPFTLKPQQQQAIDKLTGLKQKIR